MSCNLGKTRTRFTVNSLMFVILFWFLVENFKLSARTTDAQDTRDAFLESVYSCIPSFVSMYSTKTITRDSQAFKGYHDENCMKKEEISFILVG